VDAKPPVRERRAWERDGGVPKNKESNRHRENVSWRGPKTAPEKAHKTERASIERNKEGRAKGRKRRLKGIAKGCLKKGDRKKAFECGSEEATCAGVTERATFAADGEEKEGFQQGRETF